MFKKLMARVLYFYAVMAVATTLFATLFVDDILIHCRPIDLPLRPITIPVATGIVWPYFWGFLLYQAYFETEETC